MVTHGLELLCIAAAAWAVVLHCCQWRALGRRRDRAGSACPAVSILKPLKGVDHDLEENLRTFFNLDYPDYELVFGVDDAADPAAETVRRVAAEHPGIPARLVIDGAEIGFNPKVNNLANILRRCRHDLLLISDSNVAVGPDYLRRMVAAIEPPGVGLVTSAIRGVGDRGLGGALEAVQLNTFVMGGVALAQSVGRVAAVGKSMLLHRRDLGRIGGFAKLGGYLAEDQVCGEAIAGLGLEVVVSPWPVDNVLGKLTVGRFVARHLRWARIRRHIDPVAYAAEILSNPVLPAILAAVVAHNLRSLAVACLAVGVMSVLALISERRLGLKRNPLRYPVIELLRGFLVGVVWPVPFVSSRVAWRGRRFRIAEKTRLVPDERLPDPDWGEAGDGLEGLVPGRVTA